MFNPCMVIRNNIMEDTTNGKMAIEHNHEERLLKLVGDAMDGGGAMEAITTYPKRSRPESDDDTATTNGGGTLEVPIGEPNNKKSRLEDGTGNGSVSMELMRVGDHLTNGEKTSSPEEKEEEDTNSGSCNGTMMVTKANDESSLPETSPMPLARSYQLEALEKAMKQNTIVFLETGSGKTLIAIMLLRSFAHLIRKPSPYIAVFLVPTVVLVTQQGDVIRRQTDLKVGKFWGEMGVGYWDATIWKQQVDTFEVIIMTPALLLSALRHSFLKIDIIKLMIFDECHNARGKHPYACIMTEFYHSQLQSGNVQLPRIFGMTASPIKAKGLSIKVSYWDEIRSLEDLMNSKVYTCASQAVLAKHIRFATAKVKTYEEAHIPNDTLDTIVNALHTFKAQREQRVAKADLSESDAQSASRRLTKLLATFLFCLAELGIYLAFKAAKSMSSVDKDIFFWGNLEENAETIVRDFCLDAAKIFSAHLPTGEQSYVVGNDLGADKEAGFLTHKVVTLIETLLEYRSIKDLRCIIFVERVIAAIVLPSLLNELFMELFGWKAKYTAGNASVLQSQSRRAQNQIVDEFRMGMVNIIVATSILEEGLDVQNCNLVIRFDPSSTVCSFIQSRGRARMQNSEFILMVRSGDNSTLDRMNNYLASGEIMRKESLSHASQPCSSLDSEIYDEYSYRVESTGAIVNMKSSVSLLFFYCSRLPSDRYFKPAPRFDIDKDTKSCVLHLPKSCRIHSVKVEGDLKIVKQLACLEACKQLHQVGALTDNLVPDVMEEKEDIQELGCVDYIDEQPRYFPLELIGCGSSDPETALHCYLIELHHYCYDNTQLQNVILAVKVKLEADDDEKLTFELNVDGITREEPLLYLGQIKLTSEKIKWCQKFQVVLLKALLRKDFSKPDEGLDSTMDSASFNYLLLPSIGLSTEASVDWILLDSILFPSENLEDNHTNCFSMHGCKPVKTKTGVVFSCRLENSLVCTSHNGNVYCVTGILHNLDANSTLELRQGESMSYKEYFKSRHDIDILYDKERLLNARYLPKVRNYLKKSSAEKGKEPSSATLQLPPELCSVIISSVPHAMFFSFSYLPAIMHRIESFLLARTLKRLHMDQCTPQNCSIPTNKILEAITTKKCQENFHMESLETLGDSFLKYVVSRYLFTTYENDHEGLLSVKKEKLVSNDALCKLACDRNIPGFIRSEPFDPYTWEIPGDHSLDKTLKMEMISPARKVYIMGSRKMKSKRVADIAEALIGAYVSTIGEAAAISFLSWLGLSVHCTKVPTERQFPINAGKFVNVQYVESLLKYKFHDTSLLVEAFTHGSFMHSEIPRCYQRLEFIGDAVIDYVITVHLYNKYPGLTPGVLTDMRSCSVNNDCYALCAIKFGLQKQILHFSTDLQRHITNAVESVERLGVSSTFGWSSEISLPKVLGDIIESLGAAILLDSGFNEDKVLESILPLLEPIVTPETVTLHPVRELHEFCRGRGYIMKKPFVTIRDGVSFITMEVDANGVIHSDTCSAPNKDAAKKLACKNIFNKMSAEELAAKKLNAETLDADQFEADKCQP
ncbi:hypothetical protein DM860_001604 [Cuscuta australis]|uniref:Uncharacterized protein n=1 Tax=Cuscuta australis TaxID=267555 RepID=A0A328EAS6_9ASTE|nr:hypothetical protein DM860_001604 [Cuscuta australis]